MSSYKAYPSYKDSGLQWLVDIPEHWGIKRIKYVFKEITDLSGTENDDLLSVSQYTGVTKKSDKLKKDELLTNASSLQGYKKVQIGDLVSNIMLAWNGSLGVSPFTGITSPAYGVYRLKMDYIPDYYHYLFRTNLYKAEFKRNSTGVIESRLRLYSDDFFRISTIIPPFPEQTAIVQFLDQKTAEIRAFIELKERTIALLKERKTAIINEVVTKGLDPNVEMKDSGMEWLGKIPKHWKQFKIGHISKKVSIKGLQNPTLLSVEREKGVILRSDSVDNWNIIPEDLSGYKLVKAGNLVLNKMKTWQGSLGVSSYEGVVSPAYIVLEIKTDFDIRFLHHQLRSKSFINEYNRISYGIRPDQWDMHFEDFKQMPILIPDSSEQIKIVEYIDEQFRIIEENIVQIEKEISLIKEYQQSLISDAVTGKIDVRGQVFKN